MLLNDKRQVEEEHVPYIQVYGICTRMGPASFQVNVSLVEEGDFFSIFKLL